MDVRWSYLGLVPYAQTLRLMESIREKVRTESLQDHLLLLQHKPVITRGNSEKGKDGGLHQDIAQLRRQGIEVMDADRGGKTTCHGPGQLVGYMVVDLKRRHLQIKEFANTIMEILAQVLDSYAIEAQVDTKLPGLFVNGSKIGFMGMNVQRHITTHGFALNVNNDLSLFENIIPCGLEGVEVTSMEKVGGMRFSIFDVYWRFVTCFGERFGDEMTEIFIEDFLG